jgi:hypothetical protein
MKEDNWRTLKQGGSVSRITVMSDREGWTPSDVRMMGVKLGARPDHLLNASFVEWPGVFSTSQGTGLQAQVQILPTTRKWECKSRCVSPACFRGC